MHDGSVRPGRHVVAVKADVEVAERDLGTEQLLQRVPQAACEKRAAAVDPDERWSTRAGVSLGYLVCDAGQRPLHVLLAEDDRSGAIGVPGVFVHRSFLASRDRVKGTCATVSGRRDRLGRRGGAFS